jgi:hypothetical protein
MQPESWVTRGSKQIARGVAAVGKVSCLFILLSTFPESFEWKGKKGIPYAPRRILSRNHPASCSGRSRCRWSWLSGPRIAGPYSIASLPRTRYRVSDTAGCTLILGSLSRCSLFDLVLAAWGRRDRGLLTCCRMLVSSARQS